MTPKEKAIELVHKFKCYTGKYYNSKRNIITSKQCALIAVDEMIEMLKELERVGFLKPNSAIQIIEEVKKEIELL